MRLADFIDANRETVLLEWEAFARTMGPVTEKMDIAALRDHASEMLSCIATDLRTPQNDAEQAEKSKGNAGPAPQAQEKTAAEKHGADRADSGFSIEQIVSEYRALRASVIRLWTKVKVDDAEAHLEDLTRFNEAIDQSLAESVTRYTQDLDYSKEMFLAILGHDLRNPLGAIITSSKFMLDTGELAEPHLTLVRRIESSSSRINLMVGDLLDFTRSRLGGGIPIERAPMRMENVVRDVVDELLASHPGRTIELTTSGEQAGEWDAGRISQVMANLLGNALEHGSDKTPVSCDVRGEERDVVISVHNRGPVISRDQMRGLFEPLKRTGAAARPAQGAMAGLGLGLYIVERIVTAHHGTVDVQSSEVHGTTFTVRLPRR
ncbi:MAG: ATP-binding region ATPase domain protein [Gemmatimonadetes bacterium]|nr:ATP-binding region ATPase domain protein [Gemmatimonadota bacterium]